MGDQFCGIHGERLRRALLETAMRSVAYHHGAPGNNRQECDVFHASEDVWEPWLGALPEELRACQYRPSPVRRVHIPKGDGRLQLSGNPTVKDRVVQTAMALLLLPNREADSHPNSSANRPKRGTSDAVDTTKKGLGHETPQGDRREPERVLRKHSVRAADADGGEAGERLEHPVADPWLATRADHRAARQGRRRWGRRGEPMRHPQGGVILPSLANLYLSRLDWELNERCELKPVKVRCADDLVILARPWQGGAQLGRLNVRLGRRGLRRNDKRTRLVYIRRKAIRSLAFAQTWRRGRSVKRSPLLDPRAKSRTKLRSGPRGILNRETLWKPCEAVVGKMSQRKLGRAHILHHGNSTEPMGRAGQSARRRRSRRLWR